MDKLCGATLKYMIADESSERVAPKEDFPISDEEIRRNIEKDLNLPRGFLWREI